MKENLTPVVSSLIVGAALVLGLAFFASPTINVTPNVNVVPAPLGAAGSTFTSRTDFLAGISSAIFYDANDSVLTIDATTVSTTLTSVQLCGGNELINV